MITVEQLKEISLVRFNEVLEENAGEVMDASSLIPEDEDDLHDFLLLAQVDNTCIEDDDNIYQEVCNLLKNEENVNIIINAIETEYDLLSYDPWREHCDADFYGV